MEKIKKSDAKKMLGSIVHDITEDVGEKYGMKLDENSKMMLKEQVWKEIKSGYYVYDR